MVTAGRGERYQPALEAEKLRLFLRPIVSLTKADRRHLHPGGAHATQPTGPMSWYALSLNLSSQDPLGPKAEDHSPPLPPQQCSHLHS